MTTPKKKSSDMPIRNGRHEQLEAEADALLFGSLKGITSREEKSDILTPWKEKNRKSREILSKTGHPIDAALRKGIYHRAYNRVQTHLNSYDGATRPVKYVTDYENEEGGTAAPVSSAMKQVFGVERDDD